nr:MAG: peptide ABC transporter [Bacillota bacterium]
MVARVGGAEVGAGLGGQLGLDRPWYVQYGEFVFRAIQGDFGVSFRGERPVLPQVLERFQVTLQVTAASLTLAALCGIPLGVLAAVRRHTWVDYLLTVLALLGVSMPSFWFGILLMHLFALKLRWLPPSGAETWRHLILPSVTIAVASIAFIARMTRSALIEELQEDYVRTARAKGLRERTVIFRHALRNAFIPVLTTLGLQFGSLLSGAVIVETVFSLPGLGRLAAEAIKARDLPVIQGAVLWAALVFGIVNLIVDLGYAALDPRIRYE